MSKYTQDDNRSMQLNPNNDRYYVSRGIDRYDDNDDYASSNTQFSPSMEAHFERHQQLRNHACPVGCHQKSMYPPSQYDEYECGHQRAHQERPRLLKTYLWTLDHIQELESKGERIGYWKYQARSLLDQLQIGLDLWIEEHTARKERAKAMPHIYR